LKLQVSSFSITLSAYITKMLVTWIGVPSAALCVVVSPILPLPLVYNPEVLSYTKVTARESLTFTCRLAPAPFPALSPKPKGTGRVAVVPIFSLSIRAFILSPLVIMLYSRPLLFFSCSSRQKVLPS